MYRCDLEEDCELARRNGATHVITLSHDEVYPDGYLTVLDQGEIYKRLDGEVVPYLFQGMITMTIRWLLLTRPHRSYFGLKDIAQYLLVKRAVVDLMFDVEICDFPCIRYKSGIPVSSRMMNMPLRKTEELCRVYHALELGRKMIADGILDVRRVLDAMMGSLNSPPLSYFTVEYAKLVLPADFSEPSVVSLPIIMHIVLSDGNKMYFDGHFFRSQSDIDNGPPTHWLENSMPPVV